MQRRRYVEPWLEGGECLLNAPAQLVCYRGPRVGAFWSNYSLSAIEAAPLRIEERAKKVPDGAGGLLDQSVKFPVWFDPVCAGGTPMCEALKQAAEVLVQWCDAHQSSYPPTVIHVTDGQSTDGSPEEIANALQRIHTGDGEALLFNLHIDASGGEPVIFPSSESSLPDSYAKSLFRMSSAFPGHLLKAAQDKGYASLTNESRFFGYKAGYEGIVDFFDIGTRASNLR